MCSQTLRDESRLRAVACSPDGACVVTGSEASAVKLWRLAGGAAEELGPDGHTAAVNCVAFAPDGRYLASGSDDCTVRVWRTDGGRCLRSMVGGGFVNGVGFAPDGVSLAAACVDRTARVFSAATGESLRVLKGHQHLVGAVRFAP